MEYAVTPPPRPWLPVRGAEAVFPVHRIYCVGRNYAAHTIEMGGDPSREAPFFFQKNPDNLVISGADFPYPPKTREVHHEVEMVVALGRGGTDIAVADALDCVWGYGVALDMTRRDLQAACKKAGRPWEIAKAFEHSCPCSELVRAAEIGHRDRGTIRLRVNGETRQEGDLGQMIWKVPEMISILSGLFELRPGDLILTGTPSGVGPVTRGDLMEAELEGVAALTCRVV